MLKRWLTLLTTVAAAFTFMLASGSAASAAVKTYNVAVGTCFSPGSGTDADIWIRINGLAWSTGWVLLDTPNKNDFELGNTDNFKITSTDLGYIQDVSIWFQPNPWDFNSDWCRRSLTVSSNAPLDYRNNSVASWYALPGVYKVI